MSSHNIDRQLDAGPIALPLWERMEHVVDEPLRVIVDLRRNLVGARERVIELAAEASAGRAQVERKSSRRYVYLRMPGPAIRRMAERDRAVEGQSAIYRIWPDFAVQAQLWRSAATVKADACRRTFQTSGQGIVWAVADSGIDGRHPHFSAHANLADLPAAAAHMDFTQDPPLQVDRQNLGDPDGHGTHVAGIIAGECATPVAAFEGKTVPPIAGIAPLAKLVSYRVLTGAAGGDPVSNVIAALEHIQEVNGYGRTLTIHGVNLSLGYEFNPAWFACGQSPLCVEVDHLVRSGVVVVAAAGNTGLHAPLSINDPGNAERAITVGATHRDMPHTYGVSYFSSKGPTGDGRPKPDLVAPGERIVSAKPGGKYIERSGTSMAAAHVSGVAAGLLSVRAEFLGQPERVKRFLTETCLDLNRDSAFQGHGLVDMMRAIQAI